MAADVAVQETIIPVAVVMAIPFLVVITTAVSGLFYCFSSVAAAITIVAVAMVFSAATIIIAVIGLSGLSFSPASVAAIMAAANIGTVGGVTAAHFKRLLLEYLPISII